MTTTIILALSTSLLFGVWDFLGERLHVWQKVGVAIVVVVVLLSALP